MQIRSAEKTTSDVLLYWLVYRDPCNDLCFLYTWIVYLPYCTAILQQFLVIAHRSTKKEHSTLRLTLALGSGLQKGAWDCWVKTDSEKIPKKKPGTDPPHTPKSRKKIDMLQKKQVLKGPRVCSQGYVGLSQRSSLSFPSSFQNLACYSFQIWPISSIKTKNLDLNTKTYSFTKWNKEWKKTIKPNCYHEKRNCLKPIVYRCFLDLLPPSQDYTNEGLGSRFSGCLEMFQSSSWW